MIGTDLEFFLKDKAGAIVPAYLVISNGKHNPYPLNEIVSISWDNIALEVNTKPAKTPEEFFSILETVSKTLEEFLEPLGLELSPNCIEEVPDKHKLDFQAVIAGCEADFDAFKLEQYKGSIKELEQYLDEAINPSIDLWDIPIRSAGGHIHLSGSNVKESPIDTLKEAHMAFMKFINPLLNQELENKRHLLYGKGLSFRLNKEKYLGVEYRSPSNAWYFLRNTPEFKGFIEELFKLSGS